jgi:septum formation protein
MAEPHLILASASPRRQQLLREAGYAFEIDPAEINEDQYPPNLMPVDIARHLANAKADAVAVRHPEDVVLAADTVVAFGDTPLGKPRDAEHARAMLQLLEGTTHIVITAVAVVRRKDNFRKAAIAMSAVRMRNLRPDEIERYIASGEWQGKAGGYGIQDQDPFVTRMSGSHSNIVGLPMKLTAALLKEAGIEPDRDVAAA